jgi:hypothetical protein
MENCDPRTGNPVDVDVSEYQWTLPTTVHGAKSQNIVTAVCVSAVTMLTAASTWTLS